MVLSEEVEEWFIKHFAGENRRKAMKYLKPHHRKESHSVTFFIGKIFLIYTFKKYLPVDVVTFLFALLAYIKSFSDQQKKSLWTPSHTYTLGFHNVTFNL